MSRRLFEFDGNVKYPGIVAVKKALEGLIQEAKDQGDADLVAIREERYKDLTYMDIELENLHQFSNGRILVCVIVRQRGWLRYDLEIGVADMFDIIEEYKIPFLEVNTKDEMKTMVADKSDKEPRLVYQTWRNRFAVVIDNEAQCQAIPDLLGQVRFSKIERFEEPYDPEELNSGIVAIEDLSVGTEEIFVYNRDDYTPDPTNPEDMVITRVPMEKGITTLNFKLNKPYTSPVWDVKIAAPDLIIGDVVVSEDGQAASVELSLDPKKEYSPGNRKIEIIVTVNGDEWTSDKTFEHTPITFSSRGGLNSISNVLTSQLSTWGGNSATGIKAYGPIEVTYKANDDTITNTYEAEISSYYTSGSSLYVKHTCPEFPRPGLVTYPLLVDGAIPDTSNWVEGWTGVTMHPPKGATKIVVEPISVVKGDTEYDFIGTVNIYWDDGKKSPVEEVKYEDLKLGMDEKHNGRAGMTTTDTGYKLHFSVLDEAPIDTMTILSRVRSYAYTGYPNTWFEHRYNYTGGEQATVIWDRMSYSSQPGVIRIIDANGVTLDNQLTKVGFQEGIWQSVTDPKRVTEGVGFQVTLDMHIVGYNVPAKALTVISLSDGVKQYDIETMFDYVPVDIGTLDYYYDDVSKTNKFTVHLPADGIDAEDLIVERDYNYGDGSLTTGWVRDRANVDNKTVTFSLLANRGTPHTFYRIYFANAKELTSMYRITGEFQHKEK